MKRQPVNSSTVAEVGHDEPSRILEVLFRNGTLYQYFDVPEREYQELIGASSVGQYLNAQIKGKYRYARV